MARPLPRPAGRWLAVAALLCWAAAAAAEEQFEAAGCLIDTPYGFVMNVNRLLGRLQLPVGRSLADEPPTVTAARETREETGLEVEVGALALKLADDRVALYRCTVKGPADPLEWRFAPTDRVEVGEAMIVHPRTLETPDGRRIDTPWRFPEMRLLLMALHRG